MLKTSGKIFKIIRESKNMSLKEVAAGDISVAQLSRYERGMSGITVDAFYNCLKNMAVSLDEFQYVYHNYTEADDLVFSNRLSEAYRENNLVKLESILAECQALEKEFPKKKNYRLNTIIAMGTLSHCDQHFQVSKKDVDYLTDYLFSVDEWGRYELWLFTNSVDLLTSSTLETFASEMINRTQFYNNLPENRRRIIAMLLNVISVCIEENHLQVAMKFLNYMDNLKIPETELYERILIKFYKALYSYRVGGSYALTEMEQCLGTLEFLSAYGAAQRMKEQMERIVLPQLQICK
ncbi:Rgg family transcriptional regulator [Streptococcus panodentis]|uniref:XRE family transcriptional regulator n=1 Tax=Streptococcus panodentis TaxID=1581472 RepID=A0ABS5AX83_9STRE|nr:MULTISPECIES: Rgg/GadR/MutR family transcriptional regulator [Streptococcus]KXT84788.1 HTH-type transcriptional regulator rgg [Streptococcus sp. DD11]MBP2621181.1 XRE family transcriptional regulator [Streptococcus panodentis]